jgi:integrase
VTLSDLLVRVTNTEGGYTSEVKGPEAVNTYVAMRVALGDFSPATERATRYMLLSWMRHVDDWANPTPGEITMWVTVPPSRDGKHRRESCIRRFYRWAFDYEWLTVRVGPRIPSIKGSDKRPKPIPDPVLHRAMMASGKQDRDALTLGRFAGLRAAEIAACHRDHLGPDGLYVLGKGSRERWVQVHPKVQLVVAGADGFVFPSQNGQTMSRRLGKVLPDPWTAHTLRHAFATDLYARTKDLALVARQLGHQSVTTTERYVMVSDDAARVAVQSMHLRLAA